MAISFYDASVANYVQIVGAMIGVLEKGLKHCREAGIDPETIVETRLAPDMLPFRFQVQSVAHHSLGAIESIKRGKFGPPPPYAPHGYAQLQNLLADTLASLQKLTPREVNALEDSDVVIEVMDRKMPFTATGFLLSVSLPNFFFHATTAYDILRSKGVPLRKRDFTGALRMKGA
jgi:hypothetical protein